MNFTTEQIHELSELVRHGSVVTASRARALLYLAQHPDANFDDAAWEEGETRDFVRWAVRQFSLFGVAGIVQKQRQNSTQNRTHEASVKARRRGDEYLCDACRDAPESYALRGRCQQCQWSRKQIEYRCDCLSHWSPAGPTVHHLRRTHGLTREQAFVLLDEAKAEMERVHASSTADSH